MKRYWLLFVLLMLMVSACQQEPAAKVEPTTVVTDTPTMTATASITPMATVTVTPTRTPRPTKTPTITSTPTATRIVIEVGGDPVVLDTPLPKVEPISLENINQLEEIGRWGHGDLETVELLEEENQILAVTRAGIYWLDLDTFEVIDSQPIDLSICDEFTFTLYSSNPFIGICALPNNDIIQMFDLITGEIIQRIDAYVPQNIWLSYDKSELYVTNHVDTRIWDIETQMWKEQILDPYLFYQYSSDGEMYLSKHFEGSETATLYKNGEPILDASWAAVGFEWYTIRLSDDGKYLVMGGYDDPDVLVWDVETNQEVFYHCFSDDCIRQRTTHHYSHKNLTRPRSFSLTSDPQATGPAFLSPDNRYLLVYVNSYNEYGFYQIDFKTGKVLLKTNQPSHEWITFFSDGEHYLSAGNVLSVSKIGEPDVLRSTNLPIKAIRQIEFSNNGDVGILDTGGILRIYDIENGTQKYQTTITRDIMHFQFFHHSSRILLGHAHPNTTEIWDYQQNTYQEFDFHWWFYFNGFEISADDQLVVSSAPDDGPTGVIALRTGEDLIEKFGYFVWLLPEHSELIAWDYVEGEIIKRIDFTTLSNPAEIGELNFEECQYHALPLPSGNGFYCENEESYAVYDYEANFVIELPELPRTDELTSLFLSVDYVSENDLVEVFQSLSEDPLKALVEIYPRSHTYPYPDPAISPDNHYYLVIRDGVVHIYGVPTTDD